MKKFILILLASLIGASVWAGSAKSFDGDDDLFPWPWGSECPFPWQKIQGTYVVKALKTGAHAGHILKVSAQEKKDQSGIQFLSIEEYGREGFYASGQGYAQENERIVKGILKEENNDKSYTVMVRSYAKEQHGNCNSGLVTAITFCPLRGKKCMTDSNYILERM
jgi:hypothetical protein